MHQEKLRRTQKRYDANFRLPYDLTPMVRRFVDDLPANNRTEVLKRHVFSKFTSTDTAPASERRSKAIAKWLKTEEKNAETNDRIIGTPGEFNILPRVTFDAFVATCREIVQSVLREVPPDEILCGSFSGGASTSRMRLEGHPALKYVGEAHVTPGAKDFAETAGIGDSMHDLWLRYRGCNHLTEIRGNMLFTVPKNSEIDRVCCKEPDLNMYFQKGIGDYIRKRLRLFHIDLNDQSVNQALAKEGSITGSLATIDLSSASDSISYELIPLLLPELWVSYLCMLRSPFTLVDGEWHELNMFSSMGNGFTFELESLLFYALARATAYHTGTPGRISVYGDDLIVPTEMYDLFSYVLSYFGFSLNREKSFAEGPYRESCGEHYINGVNVTPFYVRGPILRLRDAIHLANQVRRWAIYEAEDLGLEILSPEVESFWFEISVLVPRVFWGGHDVNVSDRLASIWQPRSRKRLSPISKVISSGLGGYIHWHDLGGSRDSTLSVRSIPSDEYRSSAVPGYETQVSRYAFHREVVHS